ncbi:MAG: SusC/RagA family TonB-linked outer membrane protein [Bacteroidales bacterium]|nr:SusC/RagA family TonB-linked outer membrane protein [Bacteroidales bacterium]
MTLIRRISAILCLIFLGALTAYPQTRSVTLSGKVIDSEDGAPLIGAAVLIEDTEYGTVTDLDGNYKLSIPEKECEVTFSCIGYEDVVKKFNIRNVGSFAEIVMRVNATQLEDVVVTGVYERKKESFTGASATFKTDQLKSVGTSNVLQSLRTLDPSFKMMENTQFGSNPNMMPDIEIRGKTSVVGLKEEYGTDPNQPLFILDGFETTLETIMNLNMNRVASVTLLKDAASTAIYGSKASNGVVVIETKAPARGRLQLSYKGDFGLSLADLSDYNLMNSREKLEFETLAGVYSDKTNNPFEQIRLDNLRNERLKEIERGVDTYWLSEPIRPGITHKHNLYAEGGEGKIRYGIGLSYGVVGGVMKDSDRETLEGNVDLIYRTGKFQFSNKLTINWLDVTNPTVSFSEYAFANPYYRKYNADGDVDKYLYYPEDGAGDYPVANPLWNAHLNNWDKASGFGFTNNFIFEWFVLKELRFRAKFGITKQDEDEQMRLSPLHSRFDDVGETEKGLYTNTQIKDMSYEGDLAITYGKLIAKKHMVNAVGGFNFSNSNMMVYGYSANGFTDDRFDAPSFANGYPVGDKPDYRQTVKRAASFYVNGGYVYDDRYLMDFNYRLDGASMFGTGNKFRNTWSVGLGWNIHKEKFLEDSDFFSLFKLRGSVGNPGNQNFSAYQAFSTYKFNGWMTNVFGTGVILNALGNTNLAWQETTNYDVGTDMTFWGDRVNITLDYYWKNTDPLLAVITTPGSMGVTSVAMNAGRQKTEGWEATLKISPVYRPSEGINWNITFNAIHSRSEYSDIGDSFSALNESGKASLAGTTRYYDGGSPTAIWAVRSAGIDPATGKELFIRKDGTYSFTYDVDDEVVVGDTQPDIEGLFGTMFYFKGLSLGCYFRYRWGGQVFNTSLFQKVENIGTEDVYNNQDKRALYDRWSESNREAYFKGISMVQKTEKSSRFVMDDNAVIGESFNIGYEFPDRIVRKMNLGAMNIQLTMTDLFRATSVRVERGIDYPFAKSVTMALGITF